MNSLTKHTDFPSAFSSIDHFFQDWNDLLHRDMVRHLPAVNVKKYKTGYEMDFAAPGLEKKDFKIDLDGNILSISAEKKTETKEEEGSYSKREYNYSGFSRSFTLPESINKEKISATYENGILKLSLPKKESEAKKEPVKVDVK